MTWLMSMFGNGVIAVAVIGALGFLWRILYKAKQSGVDQQKVREGEAREQNLEQIKRAAEAGAAVRPDDGGMRDDPYNRDTKR